MIIPGQFGFNCPSGFREEAFWNIFPIGSNVKQRSSSLKLMYWLNPNCKGMIIGMSFTNFLLFMPIGNPRWPPSQDID
jgi:hypothetical protein